VVPLEGENLVLGPTAKEYNCGEIPDNLLDTWYLPVSGDTATPAELHCLQRWQTDMASSVEMEMQVLNEQECRVHGSMKLKGRYAAKIRNLLASDYYQNRHKQLAKLLSSYLTGFVLDTLTVENLDDLRQSLEVTFSGRMPLLLAEYENNCYGLSLPWLFLFHQVSGLETYQRQTPMEKKHFNYNSLLVQRIHLKFPHKVELISLPGKKDLVFRDASVAYSYERQGSDLFVTRSEFFPRLEIPVEDYPDFRSFMLSQLAKEKEQVLFRGELSVQ